MYLIIFFMEFQRLEDQKILKYESEVLLAVSDSGQARLGCLFNT